MSGGTGGATTTTAGTGGTPFTGGEGETCVFGGAPCAQGLFCDAPGCTNGTCQKIPPASSQTSDHAPQCGCNGITYWNASVAKTAGMAVSHAGACSPQEFVKCTAAMPCPAGTYCNNQVDNIVGCTLQPAANPSCWGLPNTCDDQKPQAMACFGAPFCSGLCSIIKGQGKYYPGNCP